MYVDNFSYDEKLALNSIGLYKSLKDCINLLLIQSKATQSEEIKKLYTEIHLKLKQINESEWQEMQKTMPFNTPYDFYNEEVEQEYAQYEEWNDEDYNEFLGMIDELEQNERKKAEEPEQSEVSYE